MYWLSLQYLQTRIKCSIVTINIWAQSTYFANRTSLPPQLRLTISPDNVTIGWCISYKSRLNQRNPTTDSFFFKFIIIIQFVEVTNGKKNSTAATNKTMCFLSLSAWPCKSHSVSLVHFSSPFSRDLGSYLCVTHTVTPASCLHWYPRRATLSLHRLCAVVLPVRVQSTREFSPASGAAILFLPLSPPFSEMREPDSTVSSPAQRPRGLPYAKEQLSVEKVTGICEGRGTARCGGGLPREESCSPPLQHTPYPQLPVRESRVWSIFLIRC